MTSLRTALAESEEREEKLAEALREWMSGDHTPASDSEVWNLLAAHDARKGEAIK